MPIPHYPGIGLGATLSVNDGASNAQVPFAYVKEVNVPKQQLAYIDWSYLNQPDSYRRYVAGLIEPGDAEFTIHYVPAEYARVIALRGVTHVYIITFNDTSTCTFSGILQFGEMSLTVDQIVECKVSVRVTGSVVFVPAP